MTVTPKPPVAGSVVGKDLLVLPPIADSFSPALADLYAAYRETWLGGEGNPCPIVTEIAWHEPGNLADLAGKVMVGLHYLHPEVADGHLAIDSTAFEIDTAGAVLCAALSDLIALAGADGHTNSASAWDAAGNRYVRAWNAADRLPDRCTPDQRTDAAAAICDAFDEWRAETPPSPRHALERLATIAHHEGGGASLVGTAIAGLASDAARRFGVSPLIGDAA